MYRQRGANTAVDPAAFARFVASACETAGNALFVSGYGLLDEGCRSALEALLTSSVPARPLIALDPASIDAMKSIGQGAVLSAAGLCDYFLPNEEEACWLSQEADAGEAAHILHRATGTTIVVKLGAGGALLCGSGGIITTTGVPVTPVDVTGAGDSFAAALLSALVATSDHQTALDAGVRFSAAKVRLAGTQPLELLNHSG
jgi:sugar/nucleoside kinase (ribokinase family)